MDDIFCQRQTQTDLCRLYSINNYIGYEKYSIDDFYYYCDCYDKLINGLKSRNMDGFAEGRSIVNYIMDIYENKYTLLIPINNYNNSRCSIDLKYYTNIITQLNCYFEFNKTHIWINKKFNNKWYKIDSISGVNRIDPGINNNGFILVIENKLLYIDIERYLIKLTNIFKKKNDINKLNDIFRLSDIPEISIYNLYYSLKHINIPQDKTDFSRQFHNLNEIRYILDKLIVNIKITDTLRIKNKYYKKSYGLYNKLKQKILSLNFNYHIEY